MFERILVVGPQNMSIGDLKGFTKLKNWPGSKK